MYSVVKNDDYPDVELRSALPSQWKTFSADASTSVRISHSQTTRAFHPSSCRASKLRLSRATLAANLEAQNSVLVDGVDASRQPAWRCQKHPWTKTADS